MDTNCNLHLVTPWMIELRKWIGNAHTLCMGPLKSTGLCFGACASTSYLT